MNRAFDVLSSTFASGVRLFGGTSADLSSLRPEQTLQLYDMEGCPFCRLVREALTELDLEAMIYPCPKGGSRFIGKLEELGGKYQVPYLVDPNKAIRMYESDAIVAYLFATYGHGEQPWLRRIGLINRASSTLATLARLGAGITARPSKAPAAPLELYSFESSPFCRIVREYLCELEIPYLVHNVGHTQWADFIPPLVRERLLPEVQAHGISQEAFVSRSGKMMVPYLVDPNTGVAMFESANIYNYLLTTYGA